MSDTSPRLARVLRKGPLACSFGQERIWQSSRSPEGSAGNMMASEMRVRGPLDVDAIRAALEHVVMGNEILHTTFVEREGRPLQVVGVPRPIEVPLIDLGDDPDPDAAVKGILRRLTLEPFDLERGPLLRLCLLRVSADDHRLLRVIHHILTDAFSLRLFCEDVARAYEAHRRGEPLPVIADRPQYADFAAWERERMRPDGRRFRDEVDWWRRAFEPERPALRLPFSRPTHVADASPAEGVIHWGIGPGEATGLDGLAHTAGATPYQVRLAVFAAFLGLETGQEEIVLGTYAMNRSIPETQTMVGFFSNPITLILGFDPKLSFRRWLARVREVVAEAKARSEIPYEPLSEELLRSGTRPPEINAFFSLRARWPALRFAGIELDPPRYTIVGMPWGFNFVVDPNQESERCLTMFDARTYDPDGVRRFIAGYQRLVPRVLAKPNRRLRRLGP